VVHAVARAVRGTVTQQAADTLSSDEPGAAGAAGAILLAAAVLRTVRESGDGRSGGDQRVRKRVDAGQLRR
jgi:hypothetical protein